MVRDMDTNRKGQGPKQPGAGTQMNKVRDMGTQTGKQTDMHKRSGPRLTGTGAQIDRNRDTDTGAQTDTDIEKNFFYLFEF
jgi:hypothetical protein